MKCLIKFNFKRKLISEKYTNKCYGITFRIDDDIASEDLCLSYSFFGKWLMKSKAQ